MKLILFGNAILDIGKHVPDTEVHREFNLKLDDQLELPAEKLKAVEEYLQEM